MPDWRHSKEQRLGYSGHFIYRCNRTYVGNDGPLDAHKPYTIWDRSLTASWSSVELRKRSRHSVFSKDPPITQQPLPMALRSFYNEIKGLKVKELPNHVKPMLSINYVKSAIQRGLDNYHAKYIQTNSVEPLYHVCFGGLIFSYLLALPEERRHLEHKQHAKEHGH